MKAVWVFNDFGKGIAQRDLLMLLASVKLWSIHCPDTERVLYCSDATGNALYSLRVIDSFTEVILLPQRSEFKVNSSVFWSYPKLEVLLRQIEPIYLLDHDFLVLEDIRKVLDSDKVCYSYTEDARQYYPSGADLHIRHLRFKTRWPEKSANVSFLYLPFPDWTEFYAGTSLQIMEELTEARVPDSRYLIFAEQMVFKHFLSYLPSYQCLLRNEYECKSEAWTQNIDENGKWTVEEAWGKKFIHYGPMKKYWAKQEYEKSIQELCEVSGLPLDYIQKTDYLRR